MKSKNVLNKVETVGGKVVDKRQEYLSQLYERRVARKARVTVDDNMYMSLLNVTRFYHLVDHFAYQNLIQSISAVSNISE